MSLPVRSLPRSTIEVNGVAYSFRSLSRTEAVKLADYQGREAEAEVVILSWAFDIGAAEAQAFLDTTPAGEAGELLTAIAQFSGITKAGDPDPKPPTNEPS